MNQQTLFLGITVQVLLCTTLGASMEMKTCKGVQLDVSEEAMLSVSECAKEAGFEGVDLKEIPPSKLPCIGKCAFKKNQLIDDKGKPHKENIMAVIQKHLPEAAVKPLTEKMEKCLSPESTEGIDNEDTSCASYVPVFMCIYIAFMEVCAD